MSDMVLVSLITGSCTLFAACLGQAGLFLANQKRERDLRAVNFRMRQIEEFYSPLVGLADQFQALDELHRDFEAKADRAENLSSKQVDAMNEYNRKRAYANIVLLRQMVEIFQSKRFLAEQSTIDLFPDFLRSVEVVEQLVSGAIPDGLVTQSLVNRTPFYDDVRGLLTSKRVEVLEYSSKGSRKLIGWTKK